MVIAGKDRGKTGKITHAFPNDGYVVVEGVNIVKKHRSRTANTRAGQIVEKPMKIHVSNVQITDPQTGKPSRIRITREKGIRGRVAVKSKTALA